MREQESARDAVEAAAESPAGKFLALLAEKLGAVAKAEAVFGAPVERDGVTVIPVARARFGFGGGTGKRRGEEGAGGGGGAQVSPLGFIELRNGEATFRRINTTSLPLMVLTGIASALLMRKLLTK